MTGTSSFPVMFNSTHTCIQVFSSTKTKQSNNYTQGKRQIKRTCKIDAWHVLTTSNASGRPTLEFSMHHFSFNYIIDEKMWGKVIPGNSTQQNKNYSSKVVKTHPDRIHRLEILLIMTILECRTGASE